MKLLQSLDRLFGPGRPILLGIAALAAVVLAGCADLPEAPIWSCNTIPGIPGPEDFALDRWSDPPRLIVSSDDRREPENPGKIVSVCLSGGLVTELSRRGEPAGLALHPHGVDLIRLDDGSLQLFVISHPKPGQGGERGESVIQYRLERDQLVFQRRYQDAHLVSPNDLAARSDGSFYVCNDSSARGGMLELILGLRRSSVVYYDGQGSWSVAAEGLAMANSAAIDGRTVYVSATRANRVYAYTIGPGGVLTDRRELARIKGPDNLILEGSELLVAAHVDTLAFMRHARDAAKRSPSTVYVVDTHSGVASTLFADDGSRISGASVALRFEGALYLGQVFESFLLKCPGTGFVPRRGG
jgi:sugar lactone lactonase YvrE